ncbi:tRNA pseudouridine65 synthase [Malonomonas rubra DSM 5091]|uniref:tRNA pseudouridine synthase C n=1 Tax=Malonomonas rubra DSM 5091 TaxID=1122189 RepID=A0A1M6K0R2_MALRU|nr:pseudouridine synthase [Malonomonas rubra]SHJ52563.1 tRNA pseudouridine65 synthase [Malonomonas rubra DSM 5091]
MQEQLEIIYRDQWLVAMNKPAGLLVHRTNIDRHETRFALQLLRRQLKQKVYPVHRLDKPTSGVLLFALDSATARQLSDQFRDHQVEKSYLALVRGWTDDSDEINYPLVDGPIKAAYAVQQNSDKPREAITRYRTVQQVELPIAVGRYSSSRYSLVDVHPATGRRHQIRRHFKHIFHPIIGDTTYGDSSHNRMFRQQFNCHRLLLHATRLKFAHPVSGAQISLVASLPTDFSAQLGEIGLHGVWENR